MHMSGIPDYQVQLKPEVPDENYIATLPRKAADLTVTQRKAFIRYCQRSCSRDASGRDARLAINRYQHGIGTNDLARMEDLHPTRVAQIVNRFLQDNLDSIFRKHDIAQKEMERQQESAKIGESNQYMLTCYQTIVRSRWNEVASAQ